LKSVCNLYAATAEEQIRHLSDIKNTYGSIGDGGRGFSLAWYDTCGACHDEQYQTIELFARMHLMRQDGPSIFAVTFSHRDENRHLDSDVCSTHRAAKRYIVKNWVHQCFEDVGYYVRVPARLALPRIKKSVYTWIFVICPNGWKRSIEDIQAMDQSMNQALENFEMRKGFYPIVTVDLYQPVSIQPLVEINLPKMRPCKRRNRLRSFGDDYDDYDDDYDDEYDDDYDDDDYEDIRGKRRQTPRKKKKGGGKRGRPKKRSSSPVKTPRKPKSPKKAKKAKMDAPQLFEVGVVYDAELDGSLPHYRDVIHPVMVLAFDAGKNLYHCKLIAFWGDEAKDWYAPEQLHPMGGGADTTRSWEAGDDVHIRLRHRQIRGCSDVEDEVDGNIAEAGVWVKAKIVSGANDTYKARHTNWVDNKSMVSTVAAEDIRDAYVYQQ
jgi:hypothetical protein